MALEAGGVLVGQRRPL